MIKWTQDPSAVLIVLLSLWKIKIHYETLCYIYSLFVYFVQKEISIFNCHCNDYTENLRKKLWKCTNTQWENLWLCSQHYKIHDRNEVPDSSSNSCNQMSNVNCCLKTVPVIGHTTTMAATRAAAQQETNKCVRARCSYSCGHSEPVSVRKNNGYYNNCSNNNIPVDVRTKSVSAWKMKNKTMLF